VKRQIKDFTSLSAFKLVLLRIGVAPPRPEDSNFTHRPILEREMMNRGGRATNTWASRASSWDRG